jgi:tetratricopeptide (TPR) repeat protein
VAHRPRVKEPTLEARVARQRQDKATATEQAHGLPLWWLVTRRLSKFLNEGNHDLALAECDRAIAEGGPWLPRAYGARAVVLMRLARFDEALADCNRGIELEPESGAQYFGRAAALLGCGQTDAASADLVKAQELGVEVSPITFDTVLVSDDTVYDDHVPGETITPDQERGSPGSSQRPPLLDTKRELTRPADTSSLEWPAAGWQKLREKGGVRKHHAIIDYLADTWKPFLDATGAAVTLEILEQKDPGAGTALRRYLVWHPMPKELRFVLHDEVMSILAERPTRLVDAASCSRCSPVMR